MEAANFSLCAFRFAVRETKQACHSERRRSACDRGPRHARFSCGGVGRRVEESRGSVVCHAASRRSHKDVSVELPDAALSQTAAPGSFDLPSRVSLARAALRMTEIELSRRRPWHRAGHCSRRADDQPRGHDQQPWQRSIFSAKAPPQVGHGLDAQPFRQQRM